MKRLINIALDGVNRTVNNLPDPGYWEVRSIDISDVRPTDLLAFMKENNVPEDAYFDTQESIIDYDTVLLSWKVKVPMSDKQMANYRMRQFEIRHFKAVKEALEEAGYRRISSGSHKLKEFKDTSVYDMYLAGEWDRLVKYYSLSFKKNT